MSYTSGIIAALISPLITTIGFLLWEYSCFHYFTANMKIWSSFALNLYKCTLATILFLITIFILSIIRYYNDDNNDEDDNAATPTTMKYFFFYSFAPQSSNINDVNDDTTTTTTTTTTTQHLQQQQQIIGYLLLSSMIGIIIGDILWIQSLQLLGSVRVIFMDTLKPFCATLFGIFLFQEKFHYFILIGIILTVSGILCMSLDPSTVSSSSSSSSSSPEQQQQPLSDIHNINDNNNENIVTPTTTELTTTTKTTIISNDQTKTDNNTTKKRTIIQKWKYTIGYTMSFLNVILDTYGSVLTKQYGIHISVWEINCIRFGFASIILGCISITMILYNYNNNNHNRQHNGCNKTDAIPTDYTNNTQQKQQNSELPLTKSVDNIVDAKNEIETNNGSLLVSSSKSTTTTTNNNNNNNTTIIPTTTVDDTDDVITPPPTVTAVPWYMIPIGTKYGSTTIMTKSIWFYISFGVVLITYLSPTLYNYALLEISLALTLTLSSIGPLYAIPLSYTVQYFLYYSYYSTTTTTRTTITTTTNPSISSPLSQQQRNENVQTPKVHHSLRCCAPQKPSLLVWIGATLTIAGIVILVYYGGGGGSGSSTSSNR